MAIYEKSWWKQPERLLSITALVVSVVSFSMSYLQSRSSGITGMMPVLAFVYEKDGQWVLQNLGNGPALNIIVAEKATDGSQWSNPVRIPPLPREGHFPLKVNVNARWLGATYMDTEGHDYSATCVEDDSRVRAGRILPHWKTNEIRPHWLQ
jgi:hypothetical protein